MDEKRRIEKATADAFIKLYNIKMGTSFLITEYSDAPDIRCKDSEGNIFNFEITLTEDFIGDIKADLRRSSHSYIFDLKTFLAAYKAGKAKLQDGLSEISGNVYSILIERIKSKLYKDYGRNSALVIRNSSDIPWDWEFIQDQLIDEINKHPNPFDMGIWIISNSKDKIFRVM